MQRICKPQQEKGKTPLKKRCFKCWTPGCSLKTCKHARNHARIKRNAGKWRKLREIKTIHFTDIYTGEATEVFIASLVFRRAQPRIYCSQPLTRRARRRKRWFKYLFFQKPLSLRSINGNRLKWSRTWDSAMHIPWNQPPSEWKQTQWIVICSSMPLAAKWKKLVKFIVQNSYTIPRDENIIDVYIFRPLGLKFRPNSLRKINQLSRKMIL